VALRRGAATRRTASPPTLSDGCATKRGGWRGAAPRDSPMRDGTERASSAVKDSVVDAPLTEVGALARCWTLTETFAMTHTVRGAMPNAGALRPVSSALLRRALLLWSGHPTARRVRRARPPTAPQRRTRAPLHVRCFLASAHPCSVGGHCAPQALCCRLRASALGGLPLPRLSA
jgi:hypothetical protein